jgi:hypothetical protein
MSYAENQAVDGELNRQLHSRQSNMTVDELEAFVERCLRCNDPTRNNLFEFIISYGCPPDIHMALMRRVAATTHAPPTPRYHNDKRCIRLSPEIWTLYTEVAFLTPVPDYKNECPCQAPYKAAYNAAVALNLKAFIRERFVFFDAGYCHARRIDDTDDHLHQVVPDEDPEVITSFLQAMDVRNRDACTAEWLYRSWSRYIRRGAFPKLPPLGLLSYLPPEDALSLATTEFQKYVAAPLCTPIRALPEDIFALSTPWWELYHQWLTPRLGVATCPTHGFGVDRSDICDFDRADGACREGYASVMHPDAALYLTASQEVCLHDLTPGHIYPYPLHPPSRSLSACLAAAYGVVTHCASNKWTRGGRRPHHIVLWDAADVLPTDVMDRARAAIASSLPTKVLDLISAERLTHAEQQVLWEDREAVTRFREQSVGAHPSERTLFTDVRARAIVAGGFVDSIMRQALGKISAPCHDDIDVFVTDTYAKDCADAASRSHEMVEDARRDLKRLKIDGTTSHSHIQFIGTEYNTATALLTFFDFTHTQACIVVINDMPVVYVSPGALLSWLSACTVQTAQTSARRVTCAATAKGYGSNVIVRVPSAVSDDTTAPPSSVFYLDDNVLLKPELFLK